MFLRSLFIACLAMLMFVPCAFAQAIPNPTDPPTNLSQQDLINIALMKRLGASRSSRTGPVMGPVQIMQQQQMMQQQMIAQQQYANSQAEEAKRAERKAKLKGSVQQQREKDAARAEARKEKALAAAAEAEAKKAVKKPILE